MQIVTKNFGKREFDQKDVITFSDGLYGFEDFKKYILVEDEKTVFFKYLQNIENPDLCFVLADPKKLIPGYSLMIRESELDEIGTQDEKKIIDFVIVTIPENLDEISVNLLGPVIINRESGLGCQVISRNPSYTTKHKILKNLKRLAS